MTQLTPEQKARKDALDAELKGIVADYNADISDANDLIEKANDKAEAARKYLNETLTKVEEFRAGLVAEMEAYLERDDDLQYTPTGKAYANWIAEWGFDANPVTERDREKFDELDDGTDTLLSDAGDAPKPVGK